MLTSAFRAFGGEELVKNYLESLPGGFWAKFVIVMAVIFVLGFFLDFIEIAVVVVPIVAPILLADPSANITAVWLGVMIGLNIQTSFLTPPFGFALFYLRGVAPASVKTVQIYKGVVAFICLQLIALAIVGLYPSLVNYLPKRLSLTAESAPPPLNPSLQYCMEDFVADRFDSDGETIKSAIDRMGTIDISYLPKKLSKELGQSIEGAGQSFSLVADIQTSAKAVEDNADAYRPLHRSVRETEAHIREIEHELDELETTARRAGEGSDGRRIAEERMATLNTELEELKASIPAEWDEQYKTFAKLTGAESKARTTYRRTADKAYKPVPELISTISDQEMLAAFGDTLNSVKGEVAALESEEAQEFLKGIEREVGAIKGTSEVKTLLAKARRELKKKKSDPEKAMGFLDEAVVAYDEDLAWRTKAKTELLPELMTYREAIKDTIGLRGQDKLPREQALYVASCSAGHRDISLNF